MAIAIDRGRSSGNSRVICAFEHDRLHGARQREPEDQRPKDLPRHPDRDVECVGDRTDEPRESQRTEDAFHGLAQRRDATPGGRVAADRVEHPRNGARASAHHEPNEPHRPRTSGCGSRAP